MESVLVLDANQRSALAVTRSLGSKGIRVICADSSPVSIAGVSRYSNTTEIYATPNNTNAFIADINRIIDKYNIDVLYPITEITVYTLLEHKAKLKSVHLPFPELSAVKAVSDKSALVKLCNQLKINAPESQHFENADQYNKQESSYQFPVVIKPSLSRIQTPNGWISTSVTYAHTESELKRIISNEVAFKEHPFMIQECISGNGSGIFLLYNHGECIAHFAHRRIKEKPPTGGVSVLCESIEAESKQLQTAKTLLDSVNWHGVAMVEYKVNNNGKAYVIEINPRFWGSLQLAIDSGVDFPFLLHQATLGHEITVGHKYKHGQRLRWLLGDLDRLYIILKSPNYALTQKVTEILRFLLLVAPRTRYETNRINDCRPFWQELKQYIKSLSRNH